MNDVLASKGLMKRKIGEELTKAVKRRYDQIVSFSSFYSLSSSKIGKFESLEGNMKGSYSMTLSANYRLILKPASKSTEPEALKNCDTLIVRGVIDYHGEGATNNWIIP